MRPALTLLCALALDASLIGRAQAAQVCAWIVETVEDEGTHVFDLNLSADAPASVSVRFQGPGFTSASMGGELIQLDPGQPKDVDGEGFDVSPGDDVSFDVRLYPHPLSLDDLDNPPAAPLAAFTFHRQVGEDEHAPPGDLAAKQCKGLG
ncbi:MAG TPA: hypothetical protein VGG29_11210 [Caulobacteraceae bacterium]|jgi:hypothetical protein